MYCSSELRVGCSLWSYMIYNFSHFKVKGNRFRIECVVVGHQQEVWEWRRCDWWQRGKEDRQHNHSYHQVTLSHFPLISWIDPVILICMFLLLSHKPNRVITAPRPLQGYPYSRVWPNTVPCTTPGTGHHQCPTLRWPSRSLLQSDRGNFGWFRRLYSIQ